VDIFPPLNTPKIYVFLDYVGMSPDQVEGFIVNQLELYFQYVDGIQDINTRNIQQVALCELSFFPGTDMGQAMAQVVAMSDRAMSWMPKGTLPPMIMRMDSGSVPVGYLVFESKTRSVGQLQDLALYRVRTMFAGLAGISSPPPSAATSGRSSSTSTPTACAPTTSRPRTSSTPSTPAITSAPRATSRSRTS
jgi:multidrug efflux pump subunit AcrB